MKRRTFVRIGCVAASAWATRALAYDDSPQHDPVTHKAVFPRYSVYLPIAEAKGFFRKNDISVALERLDPSRVLSTLEQVDIAQVYGTHAVEALMQGGRFKIIATPLDRLNLALWTRRAQRSVEGLAGARIGVGLPGSGYSLALVALLQKSSLLPDAVERVSYGGTAKRLAALQAGELEAALFASSWEDRLKRSGLKKIETVGIQFALDTFIVPMGVWKDRKNLEFLVAFLTAITEAIAFLKNEANKTQSIDIISNYGNLPKDVARSIYALYKLSASKLDANRVAVEAVVRDFALSAPDRMEDLEGIDAKAVVTRKVVKRLRLLALNSLIKSDRFDRA